MDRNTGATYMSEFQFISSVDVDLKNLGFEFTASGLLSTSNSQNLYPNEAWSGMCVLREIDRASSFVAELVSDSDRLECLQHYDDLICLIVASELLLVTVRDPHPALFDAVPRLIECLASDRAYIRVMAIEVLRKLNALDAIPRLEELLGDATIIVRDYAATSLLQFYGSDAIANLERLLQHANGLIRAVAVTLLGRQHAVCSIHKLMECTEDDDPGVRAVAAFVLGELNAAKLALPKLRSLLRDPNTIVRRYAAYAIRTLTVLEDTTRMSPYVVKTVKHMAEYESALERQLQSAHPSLKAVVASRLARLGRKDISPILLRSLRQTPDGYVREYLLESVEIIRDRLPIPDADQMLRHLLHFMLHPTSHRNTDWFFDATTLRRFQNDYFPLIRNVQKLKRDDRCRLEIIGGIAPDIIERVNSDQPLGVTMENYMSLEENFQLAILNQTGTLIEQTRFSSNRGRKGHIHVSRFDPAILMDSLASSYTHHVEEIVRSDMYATFSLLLQQHLSENEWKAIHGVFFQGKTREECGQELGVSERTVRRWIRRAFERLRSLGHVFAEAGLLPD